jgi:hypothetical protein
MKKLDTDKANMLKHKKIYLKHFGYGMDDFVPCEHCGGRAVDIHHIIYKSQGGQNVVENLIALCRKCHDMAHNSELTASDLNLLHRRRMGGATTGAMGKILTGAGLVAVGSAMKGTKKRKNL